MNEIEKPDDWGRAEWDWFQRHAGGERARPAVTVSFPTLAECYVQDQFECRTTLIRIDGVDIRLWTEDVMSFIDMLREVAARSLEANDLLEGQ